MPTGSGKSLTYQLAAMLRPEPTLVLSPLIALMKDQVDKLPPQIAATATFVNSSLSVEESAARLEKVASGETRLVYAAPERLRQARFVEMLRTIGIGLVVVDEVHCVSMWGHDFRPDYLFIRRGLEELGDPTMLGMTATATPETAREIGVALGRTPEVVHTSVVRPNLRYDVAQVANAEDRLHILVERLRASARRLGDRVRALAPLDRGGGEGAPRARIPRGALPRGARVGGAHAGAGRLRRRPYPGRRGDDRVRHGHRQAGRAARLPRQLPRLARGLRADGRAAPGATASPARRSCSRARATRSRSGASRSRTSLRRPSCAPSTARCGTPTDASIPPSSARSFPSAIRACSSGCSSRPGSCGAASTTGAACASSCSPSPTTPPRVSSRCSRAPSSSRSRAPTASSPSRRRACAGTRRSRSTSESSSSRRAGRATCALRSPRRRAPIDAASAAARGRGRGDRRGGRRAHVAARPAQPRRDAPRIAEGAAVRAALARVPPARCGDGGGREALGAAARARGSARRGDDARRVPRAHGRPGCCAPARSEPASDDRGRRRGRRRAPAHLAARALAGGRRSRLRRPARLDAAASSPRFARRPTASSPASRGSARSSSSATATTCSPS